jgi:hypothetical protein
MLGIIIVMMDRFVIGIDGVLDEYIIAFDVDERVLQSDNRVSEATHSPAPIAYLSKVSRAFPVVVLIH